MPELSTLQYIFLFTFLGSIGSLVGGIVLLVKERFALRVSHFLASFAAGTLLGTAFFELLPESAHEAEELGIDVFFWALLGILIFFGVERFIHWFHDHDEHHGSGHKAHHAHEAKSTVPLIIISDTLHNFIDGVVIAATFLISIPLGIVTTLAVVAHEVPHEIGDFGLLLHKGVSRTKVIVINILSASVAFIGAGVGYVFSEQIEGSIPIFLALTAGFFIYIAASDIIPELHHERRKRHAIFESVLLLLGVAITYFVITYLHQGH